MMCVSSYWLPAGFYHEVMAVLDLEHVMRALGAVPTGNAWPELQAVVIDSRRAVPGALFIALKGERADGHDYVGDAFGRGAVAALVSRVPDVECRVLDLREGGRRLGPPEPPVCLLVEDTLAALQELASYWRAGFSPRVIGVTGSVGKTTTKEMIAAVLSRRYRTLKSEGSYNNEIGLPLTLLRLGREHERVVLEMGMYDVGEISDLCRIARPHVGVVTMIAPVHLERAKTMERIISAKTELVEALPPAPDGLAVLNRDDPNVMGMADKTRAGVMTYGLSADADVYADEIESLGLNGVRFRLHYGGESRAVRIPMPGRHNVETALRGAAVGFAEGLTWDEIVEALEDGIPPIRLAVLEGPEGSTLIDDTYNASPDSTIAALNLLAELDGRKIAVLGDMLELGSYEEEGHRKVGARAAEVADVLITVGPRARIIAEEAIGNGLPADVVRSFDDADDAVTVLRDLIGPDDVILVKGSRAVRMDRIVVALKGAK